MGAIVGGALQIGMGIDQANGDAQANNQQLQRERQQADYAIQGAIEKGAFESGKTRIQGTQLADQQKTAYAASGVDPTQGTAAQVQANTAALNEEDAQQQSINAAREAWGFKQGRTQAEQEYQARAANINRQGTSAILGGMAKYAGGIASIAGGG